MTRLTVVLVLLLGLATLRGAELRETEEARVRRVLGNPAFERMVAVFERDFERYVDEIVLLTEIPAPPFGEMPRAEAFLRMLRETGLEDCEIDAEGNAMGRWRGRGGAPLTAVTAHLDTVFPAGTDVTVKRVGTTLRAPGVGDDTRSLAFLLAFLRAMREAGVTTAGDLLIVGNVGEEGPGNLRGVRFLFEHGRWKDSIKRFVTVDGRSNDFIVNGALGSNRYRVVFKGPGGHSWGSFGQASPAFALGNAMVKLGKLVVPKQPKVSYNIGMVSGGTSVNSIPFEVAMEVDLRSVAADELRKVDAQFKRLVAEAVAEENATRATTFGKIVVEIQPMGERPSGLVAVDSPLLKQVTATMKAFDKIPLWETGSTDANLPISRGIPSFAMAAHSGNRAARAHSLDEWIDVEKAPAVKDFRLAAALLLSVAELP